MLPSNADHLELCQQLENEHPEVECIHVDAKNDETVWPLMKDANMQRDNLPAIMIHQAGHAKWFFGPQALDLTQDYVDQSIS